eukprot:353394-Chlamydomonas_euryale.AAC.9
MTYQPPIHLCLLPSLPAPHPQHAHTPVPMSTDDLTCATDAWSRSTRACRDIVDVARAVAPCAIAWSAVSPACAERDSEHSRMHACMHACRSMRPSEKSGRDNLNPRLEK